MAMLVNELVLALVVLSVDVSALNWLGFLRFPTYEKKYAKSLRPAFDSPKIPSVTRVDAIAPNRRFSNLPGAQNLKVGARLFLDIISAKSFLYALMVLGTSNLNVLRTKWYFKPLSDLEIVQILYVQNVRKNILSTGLGYSSKHQVFHKKGPLPLPKMQKYALRLDVRSTIKCKAR